MTFREILEKLVEETPGALGAAIIASDGIPVDESVASGHDLDLGAIAVEFQGVLEQGSKSAGAVDGSGEPLHEMIAILAELQLYFRPIDDEFFLIVALDSAGVTGKVRFLAGQMLRDLREAL